METDRISSPSLRTAGILLAGTPTQLASERLDLVNGTGFFCCRFNEHYCRHVANEKDCRP